MLDRPMNVKAKADYGLINKLTYNSKLRTGILNRKMKTKNKKSCGLISLYIAANVWAMDKVIMFFSYAHEKFYSCGISPHLGV